MLGLSANWVDIILKKDRYPAYKISAFGIGDGTLPSTLCCIKQPIYALLLVGLATIRWADVVKGQLVYLDNIKACAFPLAAPLLSGAYVVVNPGRRYLQLPVSKRSLHHYPEDLLAEVS